MRCLFLTPLKPPTHDTPSGDRAMARAFIAALELAGATADAASAFTSRLSDGGVAEFATLSARAQEEIDRVVAAEARAERRAAFVFAYHVYYRSPDLVGPAVARRLGVPYIIAEASHAERRAQGCFADGHRAAREAIGSAALLFAMTRNDRKGLEPVLQGDQLLLDLKPFLDDDRTPSAPERRPPRAPARLLAVAMMRAGDKVASYAALADALADVRIPWRLDIVGDGPARAEVESLFRRFGAKISFHGRIDDRDKLRDLYCGADLFVWPGVNEAFGLAYLEAQAEGAPVIAADHGGVADALIAGETGILAPPNDAREFARAIEAALADEEAHHGMRRAAMRFARGERSLAAAAKTIAEGLRRIGALTA